MNKQIYLLLFYNPAILDTFQNEGRDWHTFMFYIIPECTRICTRMRLGNGTFYSLDVYQNEESRVWYSTVVLLFLHLHMCLYLNTHFTIAQHLLVKIQGLHCFKYCAVIYYIQERKNNVLTVLNIFLIHCVLRLHLVMCVSIE